MLQLIPMPKKIRVSGKKAELAAFENLYLPENTSPALLELAVRLADEIEAAVGRRLRFTRSEISCFVIRRICSG